jgi:hypothetical protein
MVLRLPRAPGTGRRPRFGREGWFSVGLAALVIVAVAARVLLAVAGVEDWTVAWRIVAWLSFPLYRPLETFPFLTPTPVGRLTVADTITSLVAGSAALYFLAAKSLQRPT